MSGNKGNENSSKNSLKNYYCEYCDYSTCQKQDFTKHNLTRKHAGRVP